MSPLFEGKTEVFTGVASGIGREISLAFSRNGADVIVADVREEPRGRPTQKWVREASDSEAYFVECDVTETDDLHVAVEAATELGGVDVMANNAGVFRVEEFLEVTEAEYERMMDGTGKGLVFGGKAECARNC